MGGSASKAARTATGSAGRKYPTRTPSAQTTSGSYGDAASSISPGAGPTVHPPPHAAFGKSEAIRNDAADPDFQSMLKTVGAVQVPDAARLVDVEHMRNPQLRTLSQRQHIEETQQEESANPATRGKRSWVDVYTVKDILRMRDEAGWDAKKIEERYGLAEGVVARLGPAVKNARVTRG